MIPKNTSFLPCIPNFNPAVVTINVKEPGAPDDPAGSSSDYCERKGLQAYVRTFKSYGQVSIETKAGGDIRIQPLF